METTRRTVRTTCKIGACEPFCGLEIDVEDGRMAAVRPDKSHPITHGYACIKGAHVADYQNDPDRLLVPERRSGSGGFEATDWDTAIGDIGGRLREIRRRFGPRAIATYWGNASDSATITLANSFCHAFGSPNSFNVLSLEYTDRGAVAARMFGNENFILQPDAGRARYALLLGTNPLVTQGMTLLQRRPFIGAELRAIGRAGGTVVVVDPRRTETARIAQRHVAILPGTDLFFLLGLLQVVLKDGTYDRRFIDRHCAGFERLETALESVDIERVSETTGIASDEIRSIAMEFAAADGAFATTRVGVQTAPNTTLTEWAVQCLNSVTGNVDRPGGVYFNPGAIDVPALIERFGARRNPAPSRIGGYPQIFGGPPASVLADDVLSEDPQRIRALLVVAGNPVITFPDTAKVERALKRLDLLVTIDLYRSDTGAFAHYNLPAATSFEKGSVHFLTSTFEPYPFVEWKPKVVDPPPGVRSEWEILRALSRAAGVPFLNDPWADRADRFLSAFGMGLGEETLYRLVLPGAVRLGRLKKAAAGIRTGEIRWGEFLEKRIATAERRIDLMPEEFVPALRAALDDPPLPTAEYPLVLIGGARRAAGYNSWTHNIPALAEKLGGNWATLSECDAAALGVRSGDHVRIETAAGSIEIHARVSKDIRPGVVAVHQFWGHTYDSGMYTSRRRPGVNVNFLHATTDLDPFTGMPVYNGRPCRVEPV